MFSTIGAMATIGLFFISLNEFRVLLGIVADPVVSRDLRNILSVFAQHYGVNDMCNPQQQFTLNTNVMLSNMDYIA